MILVFFQGTGEPSGGAVHGERGACDLVLEAVGMRPIPRGRRGSTDVQGVRVLAHRRESETAKNALCLRRYPATIISRVRQNWRGAGSAEALAVCPQRSGWGIGGGPDRENKIRRLMGSGASYEGALDLCGHAWGPAWGRQAASPASGRTGQGRRATTSCDLCGNPPSGSGQPAFYSRAHRRSG